MQAINELELRELLSQQVSGQLSPADLAGKVYRRLTDANLSWEEKRPYWHYLHNSGQIQVLLEGLSKVLEARQRIPFDVLIDLCARNNVQPSPSVLAAFHKGLKKGSAFVDLISANGWDKWDESFAARRAEQVESLVLDQQKHRDDMIEKFHFLQYQRMMDQAAKHLRRMLELYPKDEQILALKNDFDEVWARNVLSNHIATLQAESQSLERTLTAPSSADQEMLRCFLIEGERIAIENRGFASDLAIIFWFMEDYSRAVEILEWSEPGPSSDWMRAEALFAARRYLEALEHLNQLELKGIGDPESTFAVSYMRAQCLFELGQKAVAIEIMKSVVRMRAKYRSAHALLLKWGEGAVWE